MTLLLLASALGFFAADQKPAFAPPPSSAAVVAPQATANPRRLDRNDLLLFHSATGDVQRAHTVEDWQQRRAEILAGFQQIAGPMPGPEKRCPLDLRVEKETDRGSYVCQDISYAAEPGGRVPAFLLVPKSAREGMTPRRGILVLMPTNDVEGNRPVVGLGKPGGRSGRNYGAELAERGYVVIAPPYPLLASYQPDLAALGYWSGTMKAIWDNRRALDVLESLPGVAPGGFGVIGFSLGGHNSIFTAAADDRIKVIVSVCGFDSFLDYYAEKPQMWRPGQGWTQARYMPALAAYATNKAAIPFDFHELVGALAPRPFLAIAPRRDANFNWQSVDRVIAAARPVYGLYDAADRLAIEHPEGEHDFPADMRAKAYAWLDRWLGHGSPPADGRN